MKFNLLRLLKKTEKEDIELYCQNPQCENPLISKNAEYIAKINEGLVHPTVKCTELYLCHKVIESKEVFCSSIDYLSYSRAEKLARKGKIKFSKLESKTGEAK